MHVIESLDDLRALVASDDVKIVCVGAKASLETPEFARAVFGTNERAITTFHKMVSSISAESTRSTVLTFGSADEGATLVELVVCALPEKVSRHNSPISSHSIASMAKAAIGDRKRRAACVVTALPEAAFAKYTAAKERVAEQRINAELEVRSTCVVMTAW